jgi:LPXTG-site transpeptidase (sortase) family protein
LSGDYTVQQSDIDAGSYTNIATVTDDDVCPAAGPATCGDSVAVDFQQDPALKVVKEVSADNSTWNDTSVTVIVGDTVYYRVRVENTGNITLTGLTVDDGMAGCTLAREADISGDDDDVFETGEEWAYTCSMTAALGTVDNTATADSNETSQDSDTASYTGTAALVADPALAKAGTPTQASVGEKVTFTLTVKNNGNAPASGVVIKDALPAIFDVTAVNVTGAPLGTLVSVTPLIGTGPAPYTVIVTLGGDLEVTDVVTITIVTTVNSLGNAPIENMASLTTTSSGDVEANNSDTFALTFSDARTKRSTLPATGFAPDVMTVLGAQPADLLYSNTAVVLEIPSLGIKIPVVGVPRKNGTWDVTWLGNQAGWLDGSAFPSWKGNSLLTGHVYLSNGLPGPFVDVYRLKYGDRIVIHAYGQKYTFAVQTNAVVDPTDTTVMKHEERAWLTLITCKEYDQQTNTYKKRVVVRAVLISVENE